MEVKGNASLEGTSETKDGDTVKKNSVWAEHLRERLKTFYKCRDLEIQNLWQRSIFLGAFLLLCFTGYGYMIFSCVSKEIIKIFPFVNLSDSTSVTLNCLGIALALIGQVMSIIWILMAKGSKRWYEVYENLICKLEKSKELDMPEGYRMGDYCDKQPTDERIWKPQAGKYSPSKLNICIGYVSSLVWMVVFCVHGGSLLGAWKNCLGSFSYLFAFFAEFFITIIIVIVLEKASESEC